MACATEIVAQDRADSEVGHIPEPSLHASSLPPNSDKGQPPLNAPSAGKKKKKGKK